MQALNECDNQIIQLMIQLLRIYSLDSTDSNGDFNLMIKIVFVTVSEKNCRCPYHNFTIIFLVKWKMWKKKLLFSPLNGSNEKKALE